MYAYFTAFVFVELLSATSTIYTYDTLVLSGMHIYYYTYA